MFFTEQLALLLETGMSLFQSLSLLAEQTENSAMASLVEDLREQVSTGKPLSVAMASHESVFSSTYVNLIAASEEGGFMHKVLEQLLHMEERRENLRSTIISALTYPAFLTAFSFFTIVFVLVFVFPKFGDMFSAIADELPPTTVVLLAFSDSLIAHWHWYCGGAIACLWLGGLWLRSDSGRHTLDRLKLTTPGISTVAVQLYLSQTLRVLGLSINHGVPIVDALKACSDAVSNREFRLLLHRVELHVREGGRIADEFEASPLIPKLTKQMLMTAEEAGNIGLVGIRLSDYYERELAKRLDRMSKLIEPVMLLVMGGLVGVIVSSLVLPIFKLSHAVG
ncbi:MAG: type II secretion system F family protein [Pseudomonadaceae bacterium]|nr:type II secretion system F family protein [Pseudomonadaceae bacterium]